MAPFARPRTVTLDSLDPQALAAFYQSMLGGEVATDEDDPGWVDLRGDGLRLSFQRASRHCQQMSAFGASMGARDQENRHGCATDP